MGKKSSNKKREQYNLRNPRGNKRGGRKYKKRKPYQLVVLGRPTKKESKIKFKKKNASKKGKKQKGSQPKYQGAKKVRETSKTGGSNCPKRSWSFKNEEASRQAREKKIKVDKLV